MCGPPLKLGATLRRQTKHGHMRGARYSTFGAAREHRICCARVLNTESSHEECSFVTIREANRSDLDSWTRLPHALWGDHDLGSLFKESEKILPSCQITCSLLMDYPGGDAKGFAEDCAYVFTGERRVHLEGRSVDPKFRRKGYGSPLVEALGRWCLHAAAQADACRQGGNHVYRGVFCGFVSR